MLADVHTLPVILLAAAGVGFGHAVMPDHWLPLAVLSRARRYRTGKVARLSLAAGLAHVVVSLLLGAVVIGVGLQFRTAIAGHSDLVVGTILLVTGAVFLVLDLRGKGHGHAHTPGEHDHDHDHDHDAYQHGHGHDHDDDDDDDSQDSQDSQDPNVPGAHDHYQLVGHGHHEHAGQGGSATAVLDQRATETQVQARGARGLAGLLVPFGAAASPDLTILPVFLAASALGAGAALGSIAVFTIVTVGTIVGLTIATALGARLLTAPWVDRSANLLTAGTLLLIGALVVGGLI